MRLSQAVLAIADISGYTGFVHQPELSLVHAEQIVTALLDTVIDRAAHPLTLNKLEGDAALLYAEYQGPAGPVVRDILAQAGEFFGAFEQTRQRLQQDRSACGCEACRGIERLRLKVLLHLGEIAIKQVRQFTELAGRPLILLHRLLKNGVPSHEYLLLSEDCATAAAPLEGLTWLDEEVEGVGPARVAYLLATPAGLAGLPRLPAAAKP
ncbi:MAG TPA: DUF2652 domain-containing protein [Nevskia sp.]|nr:DUF2652 domain-containing protein [Nevskia sp.]